MPFGSICGMALEPPEPTICSGLVISEVEAMGNPIEGQVCTGFATPRLKKNDVVCVVSACAVSISMRFWRSCDQGRTGGGWFCSKLPRIFADTLRSLLFALFCACRALLWHAVSRRTRTTVARASFFMQHTPNRGRLECRDRRLRPKW